MLSVFWAWQSPSSFLFCAGQCSKWLGWERFLLLHLPCVSKPNQVQNQGQRFSGLLPMCVVVIVQIMNYLKFLHFFYISQQVTERHAISSSSEVFRIHIWLYIYAFIFRIGWPESPPSFPQLSTSSCWRIRGWTDLQVFTVTVFMDLQYEAPLW